jgi:L-2-hydroxyglutarate oxidase LhgO
MAGSKQVFDVAVVGGGIVGLATAREILTRFPRMSLVVLEKEREVAVHQTGHNSGVIHAGMYYKPNTVMAKTSVRGLSLMYEFCKQYEIPAEKVGKLIVAVNPKEHAQVERLYQQGCANGVQGLEVWNACKVSAAEPAVEAYSALWSPNTGVVDYARVARKLKDLVVESGRAEVKLAFEVRKMTDRSSHGLDVHIEGVEPGQLGPNLHVYAKRVITCAGLHSDRVSAIAGGSRYPYVVPFRGSYFQMKDEYKDIVKANIYPVPGGGGIPVGIHFTPTVNEQRGRQMIIGPGACLAFSREGYNFFDFKFKDTLELLNNPSFAKFVMSNFKLSVEEMYKDLVRSAFLKSAQRLVPFVTNDMIEESFSGVMAQVFQSDGTAASDYILERGRLNGRVLNVRSAPSPACTASLAIAEHIVDLAEEDFNWDRPKVV